MLDVKKTTADIRRGGKKNLIILPNPEILTKKRRPHLCSGSQEHRRFDLVAPKRERKNIFFRNAGACVLLFFVLTTGMATKNTIAKKQEAEELAQKAQHEFSMAIDHFSSLQFTKSFEAFEDLESTISQMQSALSPLLYASRISKEAPSLEQVFLLAEDLARAGKRLSEAAPQLSQFPSFLLSGNIREIRNLLGLLENEHGLISRSLLSSREILRNINNDPLLPETPRQMFSGLDSHLQSAIASLNILDDLFPAAYEILGDGGPQTIVVLFQNSGEIRATGGFPGSLLVLRLQDDKITPEFFDIYNLSWKVPTEDPPPPGFDRLTKNLSLQDANYSADFPTSADRIRKMLEEAGIPGPITIVAITDRLFSEFLRLTGPIQIPSYEEELTPENASILLSFFVEGKAFGQKTPKEVINDLLPDIIAKAKTIPPQRLLGLFRESIEYKRILAHSNSPVIQEFFHSLGVTGEIKDPRTQDYLSVFSANVGGNKSDHFLSEEIFLSSAIRLDGQVTNSLKIIRSHHWSAEDDAFIDRLLEKYGNFFVSPEVLRQILGSGENHSYTSVFVPMGSVLMSADGLPMKDITTEERFGKTVFSFRFPKVAANTEESIEIVYRLPDKISSPKEFDLYYQMQPGRETVRISREIIPEIGISHHEVFYASEEVHHDVVFSARSE